MRCQALFVYGPAVIAKARDAMLHHVRPGLLLMMLFAEQLHIIQVKAELLVFCHVALRCEQRDNVVNISPFPDSPLSFALSAKTPVSTQS